MLLDSNKEYPVAVFKTHKLTNVILFVLRIANTQLVSCVLCCFLVQIFRLLLFYHPAIQNTFRDLL